MTGFVYGIVWFFPAFGFAFASIPLCVYLLIKVYRDGGKRGQHHFCVHPVRMKDPVLPDCPDLLQDLCKGQIRVDNAGPLEGWQFNRTIFFNPFLWYGALFLVLIRLYDRGIWTMWLANGIVCAAALAVILTPNRYNDLYFTCYNRAYEHFHGTEVDELAPQSS